MSTPISDRESFENSYYYFVEAVRALAASVEEQRSIYGSTIPGVAWELKNDVAAGNYLFNYKSCNFSPKQQDAITKLISRLDSMPELADLHHPFWATLKPEAHRLLELLETITKANATYLGIKR